MQDSELDSALNTNLNSYESHVNQYYIMFKKLLDDNNRNYYNHEFMFIFFASQKFKDLLFKMELLDRNYGDYKVERDYYWNGHLFIKCEKKNNFCEDLVKEKLNKIPNNSQQDL